MNKFKTAFIVAAVLAAAGEHYTPFARHIASSDGRLTSPPADETKLFSHTCAWAAADLQGHSGWTARDGDLSPQARKEFNVFVEMAEAACGKHIDALSFRERGIIDSAIARLNPGFVIR